MKTTEEMVQIRTLKTLIAEMVAAHKSTKSIKRGSATYREERAQLFVAYTAYYILRHYLDNTDEFIANTVANLREENRNRTYYLSFFGSKVPKQGRYITSYYGDLKEAVDACIKCLNKYIESHKDEVDK